MLYYKIPPKYVKKFGLHDIMTQFADGNYFVPRNVMTRIDPDIDKALEISGGITLTLDDARDEQLGLAYFPLPSNSNTENSQSSDDNEPEEAAEE